MRKKNLFWVIALVITLASAYYQRISGPTYPETGIHNNVSYKFERSHSTSSDQLVEIPVTAPGTEAYLYWKRFKTNDDFTVENMQLENSIAKAYLPVQPPAGKLEYFIKIKRDNDESRFPAEHNVVTRFKGDVPLFLAMLFSVRTCIEALLKEGSLYKLTLYTLVTLFLGGMIFGPITQLYAFGALWTGIPFGYDLTDNKTLMALIGWIIAGYKVYKNKNPKFWVIAAAILMFIIFLIPHSMFGSELDYNRVK
jgi:hypothetical protein